MYMTDIKLTVHDLCRFLGVSKRTISSWCQNGKIKAKKEPGNRDWTIKGKAFCDFIYANPRYRNYFKSSRFSTKMSNTIQQMVLLELEKRPPIYSSSEIAEIFHVTIDTVKGWMASGYIEPIDIRPTYGERLFTETSIENFLKKRPQYNSVYERYLANKNYI